MTKVVKVGPKEKHVKIPEGWRQVTAGECKKGDRYADLLRYAFLKVEEEDLGMPADSFDCLIREISHHNKEQDDG